MQTFKTLMDFKLSDIIGIFAGIVLHKTECIAKFLKLERTAHNGPSRNSPKNFREI
jgi:hypothetical protein